MHKNDVKGKQIIILSRHPIRWNAYRALSKVLEKPDNQREIQELKKAYSDKIISGSMKLVRYVKIIEKDFY